MSKDTAEHYGRVIVHLPQRPGPLHDTEAWPICVEYLVNEADWLRISKALINEVQFIRLGLDYYNMQYVALVERTKI